MKSSRKMEYGMSRGDTYMYPQVFVTPFVYSIINTLLIQDSGGPTMFSKLQVSTG